MTKRNNDIKTRAAIAQSKTDYNVLDTYTKPTIVRTAILLPLLSALALAISACKTAEIAEPKYTDMYETKTYEVKTEVTTNEIITTVFVARLALTNTYKSVSADVNDNGGYDYSIDWQLIQDSLDNSGKDINVPSNGSPEFQCTDGSCNIPPR